MIEASSEIRSLGNILDFVFEFGLFQVSALVALEWYTLP